MAKDTVNLYAESDRGIISDDTNSALTLENTSTTGTAITAINSGTDGTGAAAEFRKAAAGGATVATIIATNSVASGAFFEFRGSVYSTASINTAQTQNAGVIPVRLNGVNGQSVGYIVVSKGVA